MKNTVLTVGLLTCIIPIFSQSSTGNQNNNAISQSANHWQIHGNVADSSNFIGTQNNQSLIFKSGSQEGIRLYPNKDVRFKGNLFLPNQTALPGKSNFLYVNDQGKITSIEKSGLLAGLYQPLPTCIMIALPDGSGFYPAPTWAAQSGTDFGVLYTGVECPARVGIGTNQPLASIDVRGNGYFSTILGVGTVPTQSSQLTIKSTTGNRTGIEIDLPNAADNSYGLKIKTQNDLNKSIAIKRLDSGEETFVVYGNGELWSTGVHVRSIGNFPDYVFERNYQLMPLHELKTYVENEKHLPNMPTALEVQTNGADLKELNRVLVEKVEELTLYIINQEEIIQELTKDTDKIKELTKEVEELKQILLTLKN